MKLNTIHIFGYGEAQIISDTLNYKAGVTKFTKLQAVIDDVKSKKPADVPVMDYHAINIFADSRVSYISKEKTGTFSTEFALLNQASLNALIAEFQTLKNADPTPANGGGLGAGVNP